MTSTHGDIVWYELLTTDPQAAIAFYPSVTGWTTQAWGDQGYTMWVGGRGPLGGVMRLPEPARAMGAPPYWQANVQVDDLEVALAKVVELGGKVFATENVPEVGRVAAIADPHGAALALFQPRTAMAAHDRAQRGEVSWHELYTTDNEAGFAFYHAIAGWERLTEFDIGPMGKYLIWGRGTQQLGGMMNIAPTTTTPDGRPLAPSWTYYVTTPDLDGALARAKAAGGRVIVGPMPVPGGQQIVQLLDPQGATFALVTPPPS